MGTKDEEFSIRRLLTCTKAHRRGKPASNNNAQQHPTSNSNYQHHTLPHIKFLIFPTFGKRASEQASKRAAYASALHRHRDRDMKAGGDNTSLQATDKISRITSTINHQCDVLLYHHHHQPAHPTNQPTVTTNPT